MPATTHPLPLHPAATPKTLPLHNVAATRAVERHWLDRTPPYTLMQRAGIAVARLTLALAPRAHCIWIACGPGNNGGDGLQAAATLRHFGLHVVVTLVGDPSQLPNDAAQAYQQAVAAQVEFSETPPTLSAHDIAIDALLGIGAQRPPAGALQDCVNALNTVPCAVLAVDVPTGLNADTGAYLGDATQCVHADHTLTILTLKPGLLTAQGRDATGQLWWEGLEVLQHPCTAHASAQLHDAQFQASSTTPALLPPHASHKGSFGDVCVVGGAPGMQGAAVLAGSAALYAGAGRVYVGLLEARSANLASIPELMARPLPNPETCLALPLTQAVTVCGCGGGSAVAAYLPTLLAHAPRLVLDADALNALALSPDLLAALRARATRGWHTVLTPHPLEAARLLHCGAHALQAQRLESATRLASQLQCTVVLKGSGTVVATANGEVGLHYAGNARLATAGTGDALAGCLGAYWSQLGGDGTQAAHSAVQSHGLIANHWPHPRTLTALALAQSLQRPRANPAESSASS